MIAMIVTIGTYYTSNLGRKEIKYAFNVKFINIIIIMGPYRNAILVSKGGQIC